MARLKPVKSAKKIPGKAIRLLFKTQQSLEARGKIWVDDHGRELLEKIFGKENLKAHSNKFIEKLKQGILKVKNELAKETEENKAMLNIYYRYTRKEATNEEMDKANEQFRNLLKTLGMGALLVIPLSPITIPVFIKIGDIFGINILPKWFKDQRPVDSLEKS
jgi:hypothetical protein